MRDVRLTGPECPRRYRNPYVRPVLQIEVHEPSLEQPNHGKWTTTQVDGRARHRTQARVEDRIRCAKATGLRHLPSRNYQVNTAWCQAASIACDLLAWLRLLALDGDLATAEPKTLRYKILHTAARIAKGQRRRYLRIPAQCPWARDITQASTRIMPLPPP